jgi:outer membrane biosynthesis protein TonB
VALSDEQNAMLRLLASGEQSYDDIAALMGLSVDEVRAKVVGALAQLEAEGKPAPDVPPPLAGGAKPAAEVAPPEPEPVEEAPAKDETTAEPVVADSVAPRAPEPKPTAAASKPAKPAAAPRRAAVPPASSPSAGPPPSGSRTVTLPSGRNGWLLGGGIIAAIAVIVVVILVASGGGGGGSSSSTAATEAATTTAAEGKAGEGKAEEASAGSKGATGAELTAVDGSEAKGLATFGRIKNKLALQVEATGLEPTVEGTDSYTIWLAQSPQKMLPLASTSVKGSGKTAGDIAAEFEVPVEILGYLAKGTFDQLSITRTDDKQLAASLKAATEEKQAPAYTGEAILRGTIKGPIVGLATREEEEKAE